MPRFAAVALLAVFLAAAASAQPDAKRPEASPADVASVDAILGALYDVISGPAGVERDWNRLRSLFHPEARLMPTARPPEGGPRAVVWSVEDYIERAGPFLLRDGFWETEIARRTERFGAIAHVFSTYESRVRTPDSAPVMRGINSIQLVHDGTRWWVLSVLWDNEAPERPIPETYLDGPR